MTEDIQTLMGIRSACNQYGTAKKRLRNLRHFDRTELNWRSKESVMIVEPEQITNVKSLQNGEQIIYLGCTHEDTCSSGAISGFF